MLAWTLRVVVVTLLGSAALALALSRGSMIDRAQERDRASAREAAAHHPAPTPNETIYRRADDGHFYVDADVNGARIRFLVDTGATFVALSPDDARSVGLRIFESDYTARTTTANGVTRVAPVVLRQVELDQLQLLDVRAVVLEKPMPVSLLGMSFLSRLQGYETRADELVLRW
jgi:aspartyl protease family protein